MTKNKVLNGFEQREALGPDYWKDPRWKEVRELRRQRRNAKANILVLRIRKSWGID